jgi:hypothetical protein
MWIESRARNAIDLHAAEHHFEGDDGQVPGRAMYLARACAVTIG